MAGTGDARPPSRMERRGFFPPEVIELVGPPLKVGAWCGAAGVIAGMAGAVSKERSLAVSGLMTGIQWSTLGTSYYFTRMMVARSWGGEENLSPKNKIAVSGISGCVAGSFAGLLRSPSHIVPNILFWGTIGAGGQFAANAFIKRRAEAKPVEDDSWMAKPWVPLRKMSDSEYEDVLSEKMLAIDAEMALIDDRIAKLRVAEQKAMKEGKTTQQQQHSDTPR